MRKGPIDILSNEHQTMLRFLDTLENECIQLEKGSKIDEGFFVNALKFIDEFSEKIHHVKEEKFLFVELNKCENNLHCNPTTQLMDEHEVQREYIRKIEQGLKNKNRKQIVQNAKNYIILAKEHILEESSSIFPQINSLNESSKKKISENFESLDDVRIKQKYLDLLKELERK